MSLDDPVEQFKRLVQVSVSKSKMSHPVYRDDFCLMLTLRIDDTTLPLVSSATFIDTVLLGERRLEPQQLSPEHFGKEVGVLILKNAIEGFSIYFEEIDAILSLFRKYDNFGKQKLGPFYVLEHDCFVGEKQEVPDWLKDSYLIVSWIELLKKIADYQSGTTCVYFKEKKLELDVASLGLIQDNSVIHPPLDLLEQFKEHLEQTDHQDVRFQLFKGTIIDFLGKESSGQRLRIFFERIKMIYEAYRTSFDLYLDKFSYEKLRTEAEKNVSDALKRLYDAVAILRNQAVVIATSAIATAQYSPGALLKNIVILIGILFATVVYTILIKNQRDAVSQIEEEKKALEEKTAKIPGEILPEDIQKLFKGLSSQIRNQKNRLCWFMVILWNSFILSLILFIHFNLN